MDSQNPFSKLLIQQRREKADIKILRVFFSHLQNQQRTQQLQKTPLKVIKRKESNIIAGKELPSKIINKGINIQQLVFEISNLQEEIKMLKQENQELRNLLQLGQDNLEIIILNQERKLQAYWNIQTEHKQKKQGLQISYKSKRWILLRQKSFSISIIIQTNQMEIEQKKVINRKSIRQVRKKRYQCKNKPKQWMTQSITGT